MLMLFEAYERHVPTDLRSVPSLPAMQLEVKCHRMLGVVAGKDISKHWMINKNNQHRLVHHPVRQCKFLEEAKHPTLDLVPIVEEGCALHRGRHLCALRRAEEAKGAELQ